MTSAEHVLIISPETEHHEKINASAKKHGMDTLWCRRFEEARTFLTKLRPRAVFCSDKLPDGDFRKVIATADPIPVVVLSRFAEWEHYLTALRAGACDYIASPLDSEETDRILRAVTSNRRENIPLENPELQTRAAVAG